MEHEMRYPPTWCGFEDHNGQLREGVTIGVNVLSGWTDCIWTRLVVSSDDYGYWVFRAAWLKPLTPAAKAMQDIAKRGK